MDLAMMARVAGACEDCEGRRFTAEDLGYKLRGRDISEVLAMSVGEACGFFTGTPAELVSTSDPLSARHLREYVS